MFSLKKITILSLVFLITSLAGLGCKSDDKTGGIFVSRDKGETWEQKVFVRQDNKDTITISELNINKIIQDKLNENIWSEKIYTIFFFPI